MLGKHHFSPDKMRAYWQLMRADKPIGIYLLLWPTMWALILSSSGSINAHIFAVFIAGVVVMRSAGCVINDYADRHVDGAVERTAERPLARGAVSEKETLILFFVLVLVAFLLVLTLNLQTILLSLVAVLLASLYPFMKRFTYLPQFVLGAAFSWGMPMAFMAQIESIPGWVWLLYLANLLWTVAYDTYYAMVDRDDDVKIGVKSTAILFGQYDRLIIGYLKSAALICLLLVGWIVDLFWPFYLSLILATGLFIYQLYITRHRDKTACFEAFLHNHYVGLVITIGLLVDFIIRHYYAN